MIRITTTMMAVMLLLSFGLIGSGITESADTRAMTQFQGTVTDAETGEPLDMAFIYCVHNVTNKPYRTTTDLDGYYILDLDTSGEYKLIASKDEYEPSSKYAQVHYSDIKTVNFELEPMDLNGTVYGTVYDSETEEPLEDARVRLENIDTQEVHHLVTEKDGKYQKDVVPGNFSLRVTKNNYQRYDVELFEVSEGEKKKMDVPLEEIKNGIRGVVTDENGDPLELVEIVVQNNQVYINHITDQDGRYDIRIPPGQYEISARKAPYRPYNEDVQIEKDEIKEHDIEMKRSPVLGFIERILMFIWNLLGMDY